MRTGPTGRRRPEFLRCSIAARLSPTATHLPMRYDEPVATSGQVYARVSWRLQIVRWYSRAAPDEPGNPARKDHGPDRAERLREIDAIAAHCGAGLAGFRRGGIRRRGADADPCTRGSAPHGLRDPGRRAVSAPHGARQHHAHGSVPEAARYADQCPPRGADDPDALSAGRAVALPGATFRRPAAARQP